MKLERTGIVLYTEKYQECVNFYSNVVELPILFVNEELTCFDFGGSYLMVEIAGVAVNRGKTVAENPTCLRFNVEDVIDCTTILRSRGVEVDYQSHPFGSVAKFFDPDGNLCALRDEKSFSERIIRKA